MMHIFPRTFALPLERGHRLPDADVAPLTPAAYLRLCREASGQSQQAVAARLSPDQADDALTLVQALEAPGNTARRAETLDALRNVFPFDPDVYRQLKNDPADRHPRICRGCGASHWDARDTMGDGLAWATETACTRCFPEAAADAEPAIGCYQ